MSPMMKSVNVTMTPKPTQPDSERIVEFEDGKHTVIDLDLLYGRESQTGAPPFERARREMCRLLLVDLLDLSLDEYSAHYVCHSEARLGSPVTSIRARVGEQLRQFFEDGVKTAPFGLWSQVAAEHHQALAGVLPLWLRKDLVDMRARLTRAYARNKLEKSLKEFHKTQAARHADEDRLHACSTQTSEADNTVLTEAEYSELVVSDVLGTPFHAYFEEQLGGSKSKAVLLSFMAYVRNNDPEVITGFNNCAMTYNHFYKSINIKNRSIEEYKKKRGFPLILGPNEEYLFSFESEITQDRLIEMIEQRMKQSAASSNLKSLKKTLSDKIDHPADI
mmetsp:Transcript_1559/g.1851  ORF Transcript_1559/g.1851 Transcript_1559/m.1851 type:complete len:334 (-) Transcript_1559:567-1568(-)